MNRRPSTSHKPQRHFDPMPTTVIGTISCGVIGMHPPKNELNGGSVESAALLFCRHRAELRKQFTACDVIARGAVADVQGEHSGKRARA